MTSETPTVRLLLAATLACVVAVSTGCDAPQPEPVEPTCADGQHNGDETDVDCGGACAPCADGQRCAAAADCASGHCASGTCAAAPGCTPESDAAMCARLGRAC
ncbi:MAG: hypothetical protein ACK4N5_23005, partial [Myxococcales bacterium]